MDLYSSDVGAIQEGNMRTKAVLDANQAIKSHNDNVALQIRQLKGQQQSQEASSIMGQATQQFWAAGKIPDAAKSFSDFQKGLTDFRGNPTEAAKQAAQKLASKAPKAGQATGDVAEAGEDVGKAGQSGEEAVAEAGGEELAEGGLSTAAKGLTGITALASGGFDIYKDFKASEAGGSFTIAGDNWASKTSNVLQIGGAIADLGGTVFPPLAILGGVADVAAGVFGEIGAVKDEGQQEQEDDTTQQQQTQQTQQFQEQAQATTGRVEG